MNGVKSSGIWKSIWGTLTALPTGFTSLYDWCVSQFSSKLDKVGNADSDTKVFWNSTGDTLNVKGNMRVNVDGTFGGLYVPQALNMNDD